jgi:nitroreductase
MEITGDGIPEPVMRYIVKAGIRAPSGDNAQPWKFAWNDNKIRLYLNPDADHSFFNVRQIASAISCGAVLENMRIAAAAFGLEAKATYLSSPESSDLMASIELEHARKPEDPLHGAIWRRCTNRKPFAKKPIQKGMLDSLVSEASKIDGVKLHIVTEDADIKKLAKVIFKVDRIRTEHRPLHEHLHSMIRYTEEEAMERRDGFPLKNLEAGLAGELFLKYTRPWSVMNVLNRAGFGKIVAAHSLKAMATSSVAVLITVSGMSIHDFVRGGQALERLWLKASQEGLSVQPMTAITLFWSRWQLEGGGSFQPKHETLLSNVWMEYRQLFPEVDFLGEGHVMLLRLGYGKDVEVRTLRRDIEDLVLKAEHQPV